MSFNEARCDERLAGMKRWGRGLVGGWQSPPGTHHGALLSCVLLCCGGQSTGTAATARDKRAAAAPAEAASPPPAAPRVPEPLDIESTLTMLSEQSACVKRVAYGGSYESCTAAPAANGRAIQITVVTECGGDSCSVEAWLLRTDRSVEPLERYAGGGIAFSPELDFYVTDEREFTSQEDMTSGFYTRAPQLVQVDLGTGESRPFAACMSPALAPDDDHFVCRNRYADVLRVPVSGGSLELVLSNPQPEPVLWSPYSFTYPGPVEFTSTTEMLVAWGNGRDPTRHLYAAVSPAPLPSTPLEQPRPLDARLATCDAGGGFEVATICPVHQAHGFPAVSSDGNTLLAIEAWSSCCADMAKDTLLEFALPPQGAVGPPRRTLLWEFDQETGRPTLSEGASRQRIARLNQRATRLGARPLVPVPAEGLQLGRNVVLLAVGPVARLLDEGRLVHVAPRAPFEQKGFCCNAEPTPPGQEPIRCPRQAVLEKAWWGPETRWLVTTSRNYQGPDGCELGPRFDVTRFPDTDALEPLLGFELTTPL